VVSLIMKNYTVLSEKFNKLQQQQSRDVIRKIKDFESAKNIEESAKLSSANELLDEIRIQIENIDSRKDQIMKPFDEVKKLVLDLFNHSGIKLERINLGDAASAVNSDKLSAGEKQMLSFIVYNAFYQDSVIIIDEPELSLHVDWQRKLFPILQEQQSSNQFIIATHSPFIYGKYPDKELKLDSLRGDEGL
jgi:predicted ATPase